MDFNATIDLIIKDLNEAREIIDDLKEYPGVPVLQVELAKSKCKSAGEVISLLKSLRDNFPVDKKELVESEERKESQKPVEKKSTASSETISPPPKEQKIQTETVRDTPPPVTEEKQSKDIPKKAPESAIIADKFSHLSNRFNEQLGDLKSDDDLSEIMKTQPLSSLSEAIGVNDKFLFIREIFDGNKETYTQAISQLDNAENLTDAMAVIMKYTGDSEENKSTKQLVDLIKRKFPPDE